MDLVRLEQIARTLKTRAELEQLLENVLAKKDAEAAHIVNEVLLERFPVRARAGGGATPTEATFQGRHESFENGKEAYVWLAEQFRRHSPRVLEEYAALQKRSRSRAKGSRFARSPEELFPPGSSRASKASHYSSLSGGWFADVNLDHKDKFATLLRLSYVSKLSYPEDWDFRPVGGTQQLREHQEAVVRARELLAEFLAL